MRKTPLKAAGRNDALFGIACIVGITALGFCGRAAAQDASGSRLTDAPAVDARYHDTDQHDLGDTCGARAVATLKAIF